MQASDWTQINITFVPNHKDSNESWNWFVKGGIPGALSPVLENFRRRFSWPNWPPLGLRWWETSWGALVKVLLNTYFFCHQVQDIYKGYSCLKCLKIVSERYMSPLVYSLSKILIFVLSRKTQQFFYQGLVFFRMAVADLGQILTDFLNERRRRKVLGEVWGACTPGNFFWILNPLSYPSWVSESFRLEIG